MEKDTTPPPSSAAPVNIDKTDQTPATNGSVSTPSLAISKLRPSSGNIQTFLDKAADDGLAILQSPRVIT